MKEVNYNGNFKKDLELVKNDFKLSNSYSFIYALGTMVSFLVAFMLFLASVNASAVAFFIWASIFAAVDFIGFGTAYFRLSKNTMKAEKRLKKLVAQLDKNGTNVKNLEVLNNAEVKEVIQNKSKDYLEMTEEEYWSFMDRDEQVRVLKSIRTQITRGKDNFSDEKLFLLEEEDVKVMNNRLRRTLKLDN